MLLAIRLEKFMVSTRSTVGCNSIAVIESRFVLNAEKTS